MSDEITALVVQAFRDGQAFMLDVKEVECGHHMDAAVVQQARDAIRAGREDGLTISIRDSYRTFEEQRRLYDGWCAGRKGFNPANRPGFSVHQEGRALDLSFATAGERERFAAVAHAHGFTRPHQLEPWHFEIAPQKPEPTT